MDVGHGLGTNKGNFEALLEDEYEDWLWEGEEREENGGEEVVEISDDDTKDASELVAGAGGPSTGRR